MHMQVYKARTIVRPQTAEIQQLHAQVCQALSDPTRIVILYILAEKPHTVTDLVKAMGQSQPMVSRHLKVLRERGMVTTERDGSSVIYSLVDKRVIQALDLMREVLADQLARQAQLANYVTQQA
jgi:DNA-binding transcriptional ArsR family regulator